MLDDLTVLGIARSLRTGSLNARLLRAAAHLAPPGIVVEQDTRRADDETRHMTVALLEAVRATVRSSPRAVPAA